MGDERVAKVSLTGSVPTGRKVYAAAAADVKHVTMELGGKSPLIIFDDADVENAVGGAILANFYSSGQICSNGTRVFVHKDIKQAFLTRLVERLKQAVIGDPLDERTNFGPMVSQRQMDIAQSYIAKGKEEGARLEELHKASTDSGSIRRGPICIKKGKGGAGSTPPPEFKPDEEMVYDDDLSNVLKYEETQFLMHQKVDSTKIIYKHIRHYIHILFQYLQLKKNWRINCID